LSDKQLEHISLIVGLGNPGPEYQHTRHNAGTWFVESLAKIYNCSLKLENKFKTGGSSSQNGIRDIVSSLGNQKDFLRLRIGIGHPGDKNRVTGHVLGKAPQKEQQQIEDAIDEATRCLEILIKDDLKKAMNRLHSFKAD
jgi:peptidyl-tRNA hydrolase